MHFKNYNIQQIWHEHQLYAVLALTVSVPDFWQFVVCFFILFHFNKPSLGKEFYVKLKDWMSNSVDLDETAHNEPSHLDLCFLRKPIVIAYGSERVKLFSVDFSIVLVGETLNRTCQLVTWLLNAIANSALSHVCVYIVWNGLFLSILCIN